MSLIVNKLIKDKLIPDKPKVLDLGGGEGRHSIPFAIKHGGDVTIVDKKPPSYGTLPSGKITEVNSDIRDCKIKGKYDVIICNNVLPFLSTKGEVKKVIEDCMKHLKKDGVFVFSLWGANHCWVDRYLTHITPELDMLTRDYNTYYKETSEGMVTTMNGELNYWHGYTFWLK